MAVYRGANLAWQLGGDLRLVRVLASGADALVLVECRTRDNKPIDISAILGPDWWVGQNLSSAATSGTVVAIRKRSSVKRRRIAAVRARLVQISRPGRSVQARYLRAVPIRDPEGNATLFGVHIPLASTGQQGEALGVVHDEWCATKGRKLLFADGNSRPGAFAADIGAPNYDGNGVMTWAWSKGWANVRTFWHTRKGSDHRVGTLRTDPRP